MEMTESAPNVTAQEQEVSRRHWWAHLTVHVISFGFVFVNTILIAVVLGVLIHHQRAMSSPSREGTEVAMTLRDRFPGRFLFIEEKTELAETIRTVNGSALLPVTNSCINEDKSICAGEPTTWVSIITLEVVNACCHIQGFIEDFPKALQDVSGTWRRIANYTTNDGRVAKQFYQGTLCLRIDNCQFNCECELVPSLVSAVYNSQQGQRVGYFAVENVCVCVNN